LLHGQQSSRLIKAGAAIGTNAKRRPVVGPPFLVE
jgi:hypothetical protein